jgi:hypothetical protein
MTDHNILCTAGYGQLGSTLRAPFQKRASASAEATLRAAVRASQSAERRAEGLATAGHGQLRGSVEALK